MALRNRLGGHSNSYHTYSLEEALEGIAAAGYKFVELSAVRGWTEHVPLEADAKTLGRIQRMMNKLGLMSLSLSGHSDIDFKTVLDTMEKGGFKGPLSVEIEFRGDPWPPLKEVNRAMKTSFDKLTSLGLS